MFSPIMSDSFFTNNVATIFIVGLMFKITILLPYYNRPLLLRNAITSILESNKYYPYWDLIFGDDGSNIPGRPIVEELLREHLEKVVFVHTGMSFNDKIEKGIVIGGLANEVLNKSTADAAIILGDDDELVPTYLRDLAEFFVNHPDVLYCYSKIHLYNPLIQKSCDVNNVVGKYNQWNGLINPVARVDASQIAWRLSCFHKYGARFSESTKIVPGKPWVMDTDKSLFQSLFEKCGMCHPTGLVAQYKGIHDYQLLWHKNATADSLLEYDKMVRELGGVSF